MEHSDRDAFVSAARIAADLVARPEVEARWTDESACAGMTVGGLAFHLGTQTELVVRLLQAGPSDVDPIPLAEHYARAAWVHTGHDDEANVGIREGSDAQAEAGQHTLTALLADLLARLPEVLDGFASGDPVLIPWQGWSLTAHDFLVTRLMETVVHSDDLAASVGLDTPAFPGDVVGPVVDLLGGLAVRRHGGTAVVRALSRPQRAPGSIAAF